MLFKMKEIHPSCDVVNLAERLDPSVRFTENNARESPGFLLYQNENFSPTHELSYHLFQPSCISFKEQISALSNSYISPNRLSPHFLRSLHGNTLNEINNKALVTETEPSQIFHNPYTPTTQDSSNSLINSTLSLESRSQSSKPTSDDFVPNGLNSEAESFLPSSHDFSSHEATDSDGCVRSNSFMLSFDDTSTSSSSITYNASLKYPSFSETCRVSVGNVDCKILEDVQQVQEPFIQYQHNIPFKLPQTSDDSNVYDSQDARETIAEQFTSERYDNYSNISQKISSHESLKPYEANEDIDVKTSLWKEWDKNDLALLKPLCHAQTKHSDPSSKNLHRLNHGCDATTQSSFRNTQSEQKTYSSYYPKLLLDRHKDEALSCFQPRLYNLKSNTCESSTWTSDAPFLLDAGKFLRNEESRAMYNELPKYIASGVEKSYTPQNSNTVIPGTKLTTENADYRSEPFVKRPLTQNFIFNQADEVVPSQEISQVQTNDLIEASSYELQPLISATNESPIKCIPGSSLSFCKSKAEDDRLLKEIHIKDHRYISEKPKFSRRLIKPSYITCAQLRLVMPIVLRQLETFSVSRKALCRQLIGCLYPNSPKPSPNFLLNTLLPIFHASNALGFNWNLHSNSTLSYLRLWIYNQPRGRELIQHFRVHYNAPTGKEYRKSIMFPAVSQASLENSFDASGFEYRNPTSLASLYCVV